MDDEHKRMQWASRRGMLELDLILEPFVREHYAALTASDKDRYRALMESQDQDLFAWFMKKEAPADPELVSIVATILRANAGLRANGGLRTNEGVPRV